MRRWIFSYLAGMSPYISLKIKKRHYEHHMIEAHKYLITWIRRWIFNLYLLLRNLKLFKKLVLVPFLATFSYNSLFRNISGTLFFQGDLTGHGDAKRCRLSLLTNSALVYESKCGGIGGCGVSANEYSCTHHVTLSPNKLWRSTSI